MIEPIYTLNNIDVKDYVRCKECGRLKLPRQECELCEVDKDFAKGC